MPVLDLGLGRDFNKYRIKVGSTVVIKDLKTEPLASRLNGKRGTVKTRNSRGDRWIVTLLEPHGEFPKGTVWLQEYALQDKNVELATAYDIADKAAAAYERAREVAVANPKPNPRMKHWDKARELHQEKFAVRTALRNAKYANAEAQELIDRGLYEMEIARIYANVDDDDARMQKAHDMVAAAIEAMTAADKLFEALHDVNLASVYDESGIDFDSLTDDEQFEALRSTNWNDAQRRVNAEEAWSTPFATAEEAVRAAEVHGQDQLPESESESEEEVAVDAQ